MVFGLPTPGEANWDVKLDASINAVKATADAAQPAASLEAAVAGKIGTDGALDSALSDSYVQRGGIVVLASKYGAVGDDLTDNATAIANALTDIKAAAAFAKAATLKLPAGVVRTSAKVALDAANLSLAGDGTERTTLKLTAALADSQGLVETSSTACRIADLTLDAGLNATFALYGTTGSHRLRVSDVKLKGTTSHGTYLTGSDDVILTRVKAESCGTTATSAGFFTSSCDNLSLEHCRATGSYEHGYYLLGGTGTDLTMVGCTAYSNGGAGISARYSRQTITGCVSWDNVTGAFTSSYPVEPSTKGARQSVTGCLFGGSTGTVANEVVFLGMDSVVFTGNHIETSAATSAAVLFSSCDNSTATGNQIVTSSTSTAAGLRYTSCTGFLATGNTIRGAGTSAGNAVYIDTSSTGRVSGNRCTDWNTGLTITASACNDVHLIENQMKTVTTRVSNSTSGTGCIVSGNARDAGYWDSGVPVRLPTYATASRPAADTIGNGGLAIDSDLNRPIWTNGSTWKVGAEVITGSIVWDFGSIAAGSTSDKVINVTGVNAVDAVAIGCSSTLEAGLVMTAWAVAGGVTLRLANVTSAAIDPASRTYYVTVVR